MGTFWYHLQAKLQAQEGVGKYSPEALASRVSSSNFGYFGQHTCPNKNIIGTFWYILWAQEGLGKFSPKCSLASRLLKLLTLIFGYLFNIIALWKNDNGTFGCQVHGNQKDQNILEEIDILLSWTYSDLICHWQNVRNFSVLFSNKMQCKFRTYFRTKCKFRSYFRKKCKFRSYFRKKCKFRTFCQWQMKPLLLHEANNHKKVVFFETVV